MKRKAVLADSKSRRGALKAPLRYVPPASIIAEALALEDGLVKHGPWNWRGEPVSLMAHLEAVDRHILAYRDGEDLDRDGARLSHLWKAKANLAIVIDAEQCGTLVDDRPSKGPASRMLKIIAVSRRKKIGAPR